MAKDFKIIHTGQGVYDWEVRDGDLVVVEGNEEVLNHLTYRLQVWLGESPYDRSAGLPYRDGVFGETRLEGIAGLFQVYIQDTDGIVGMLPLGEVELTDDLVLRMRPTVFLADGSEETLNVEVTP